MDNAFNRRSESLLFQSQLIFITVCSILCHGKNTVTNWFKINSDAEAKSDCHEEVQEKRRSSENVEESLEINYLELSDLDEDLSDEEKEEDHCESLFLVQLPEETEESFEEDSYRSICLVERSKETNAFFETEETFFSAKSGIFSHGQNSIHMNVGELEDERRRKVFYNYVPLSDDSFDLDSPELDSTFSLSKHEPGGHKSTKLLTTHTDAINDIVALFRIYRRSQNVNECSKGHDDLKSKTACSKEAAVFPQCANDVENTEIKPRKKRKSARRRSERRTRRSLRDIINWQTSLGRNPTVLYDVRPGTSNGRIEFHQMAGSGSNENSEDSRGVVNSYIEKAQPQNAVQRKFSIERDHLHASGVEIPLGHQNGMVDNSSNGNSEDTSGVMNGLVAEAWSQSVGEIKSNMKGDHLHASDVQDTLEEPLRHRNGIVDNQTAHGTDGGNREIVASYSTPLQLIPASTTDTLNNFFDSVSLLSVGEDEAFSFEWIRLNTFSDWPLTSIFSTTLARNGWVSLGEGDSARCYSCHVVHEGWRIGDDPDLYHSPNCRFKSGQSNNIPISRTTSNQKPNPGRISREQQQFPSPGNPLYSGNLSVAASPVGRPGPEQGLSQQGLNRPQQNSFHSRKSKIQTQGINLRLQENLTRPQEIYSRPQETKETNTAAMIGNHNVTTRQQDEDGNREEMENSQITTSTSDPRSTQAKEEDVMRSAAVTAIKEMGYSDDKIKAVIHTLTSRLPREKHKVSAEEILEVIFELNQSESGTPVGQSESVSKNSTNSTNHLDSVSENTAYHMIQTDPASEGNLNSTNADAMDNSNAELTSLKQENSSLKDQILCKICIDEKVSIAFLPCGHLACCEDCAPAMRKCPICREFVLHYLKAILVLRS